MTVTVQHDADGAVTGFLGVATDMSERVGGPGRAEGRARRVRRRHRHRGSLILVLDG